MLFGTGNNDEAGPSGARPSSSLAHEDEAEAEAEAEALGSPSLAFL